MKKIALIIMGLLWLSFQSLAQEKKNTDEAIKAKLHKAPPAFMSLDQKIKVIQSPGFKKPANVPQVIDRTALDNNPVELSCRQMLGTGNNMSEEYLQFMQSDVDPAEATFYPTANSMFCIHFTGDQNKIYVVEMNISMTIATMKSPQFTIVNKADPSDVILATAGPGGVPGSLVLVFMYHVMSSTNVELDVTNSLNAWTFYNCQLTKLSP